MERIKEKTQKLEKVLRIPIIIIEFLVAIVLAYAIYKMAYWKNTTGVISKGYLCLAIANGMLILAIILWNWIQYHDKIEKIFLSLVIPIGILYMVLMVPYYVPDEAPHIIRAYETYHGEFIASFNEEGKHRAMIPTDLKNINLSNLRDYHTLKNQLEQKTDYEKKEEAYTEAQSYPGILYVFSGIGMLLAEIFNLNIIVGMYLARICNFIFFLLLAYYAVKKIPFGKLLLSCYFLMPMMLQQAASVSPDSMINAIAIFFIAYVLYLAFKAESIKKREIGMILGASAFLAVAKVVYLPIVFLLFFLMLNKKIAKKTKILLLVSSIILSVLLGIMWYFYQTKYQDERQYVQERNINGTEQIKNILSQPVEYAKTFNHTLNQMGTTYLWDMIGLNLGWQDIQVSKISILLALFLLVSSAWVENHEIAFQGKQRIVTLCIAIGIILLVFTAMYIGWTEVGTGIIVGVQGRYFIPIGILIFLCLCMKENCVKIKHIKEIYLILFSIINFSAIGSVIQFFI